MLSSPDYDFSALWTLMWGWIGASNPITIVALITVVVVFPVVFLATKTIARAFSQHIGIRDNKILPAAVPHRGANGNAPRPAARSAVTLGPGIKVIQEGSPVSLPPHVLQTTFPNGQAPCANDLRMIRMLKSMYIMLDQTLDGAANSLSAAERMHAACSLVSRTIATLGGWRAPASVVALLQPAKDVTDVFSRRSMKNGSGAMSRGRQTHYAALLKNRAHTMEEVLSHALWAGIMPTVPTTIGDPVPRIVLGGKRGANGYKKSSTTCKVSRKGKAAIPSGVHVPCSSITQ